MNTTLITCPNCSIEIDTENDIFYGSEINGQSYCLDCHNSDLGDASVALLLGPDYPEDSDGDRTRVLIGDWFIEDKWADPYSEIPFKRTYHATSGWRGYYETTVEGWTEVLSGWTTGGWDDPVAARKQAFNEWAENLFIGAIEPPINLILLTEPTSNVFSTAISVLVEDRNVDTFNEWVNGELDNLRYALS